jgi:hypothetical protein
MNRFALLLLVPAAVLAACHVSRGNGSGDDKVSIKADDNGQVSFNLPFASGNVKLPQNMFANGNFDIDGVKMIPGGSIHGFNVDAGDKGAMVHLAFNAPTSPNEVRSYFVDQFRQKGDEVSAAGHSISGKTSDGDHFQIDIEPSAQGSSGTILIQSRH